MCKHYTACRWSRRWLTWLALVLASFGALETAGIASAGSEGTLSTFIRRLAGLHPICRHGHLGRALILTVLAWAAAHLGWGVLGFGLEHPTKERH